MACPPHFCTAAAPVAPGRLAVSADRFDPRFYERLYELPVYSAKGDATVDGGGGLRLNNYGFSPLNDGSGESGAGESEEPYQRQMYIELLQAAPAWWRRQPHPQQQHQVMEVGCGNGGGLEYLRCAAPAGTIIHGVDCSAAALRRTTPGSAPAAAPAVAPAAASAASAAAATTALPTVELHQADAARLPARDGSVDLLLSVEASGCFREPGRFLREARRVLRPRGDGCGGAVAAEEKEDEPSCLLLADYRKVDAATGSGRSGRGQQQHPESVGWLRGMAARAGLRIVSERVITAAVVAACRADSARRERLIEAHVAPPSLQPQLREFAAVVGSAQFEALAAGMAEYFIWRLERLEVGEEGYDAWVDTEVERAGEASAAEVQVAEGAVRLSEMTVARGDALSCEPPEYEEGEEEEDKYAKVEDPMVEDLPRYYDDYTAVQPGLALLVEHYEVILAEARAAMASEWVLWPEEIRYDKEGDSSSGRANDWRVFPFIYTFPADDPSAMKSVDACCTICPKTVEILRRIPGLRTALFSKLGPGTVLGAHRGWADLSNHILRCHLGLVVPGDGTQCGTWVQGEVRHHKNAEIIVFDDSLLHKVRWPGGSWCCLRRCPRAHLLTDRRPNSLLRWRFFAPGLQRNRRRARGTHCRRRAPARRAKGTRKGRSHEGARRAHLAVQLTAAEHSPAVCRCIFVVVF